ncbi:MAG: hypothetical protein ACFFAS_09660 [Promethearchaeota archaeon]
MIEFNRSRNFRIDELEFLLEKKDLEIYSYKEMIYEMEERINKLQINDPSYKPNKKDKINYGDSLKKKN